jgi:hypothetical protein
VGIKPGREEFRDHQRFGGIAATNVIPHWPLGRHVGRRTKQIQLHFNTPSTSWLGARESVLAATLASRDVENRVKIGLALPTHARAGLRLREPDGKVFAVLGSACREAVDNYGNAMLVLLCRLPMS